MLHLLVLVAAFALATAQGIAEWQKPLPQGHQYRQQLHVSSEFNIKQSYHINH